MAMAVISIDTDSQQCTLTVDGALVQADEVSFSKGTDYDGNPYKRFSYTMETMGLDSMKQMIQYMMVPKDSPEYSKENAGLVIKEIKDKDRLYKEVEAFVNESNAAVKVVKNGSTDTPYCVMLNGKTVKCYTMMKDAQDHMNRMMNEK
jgi:hypothetical protein